MTPRHRPFRHFVLIAACIAPLPSRAGAEPMTFALRGTVTDVMTEPGFRGTPAVDWPAPGTTFSGTYTFDTAEPDTAAGEEHGVYTTSPGGDVHVAVGDFRWHAPASFVSVIESAAPGGEDVYEAGGWIPGVELVSHPDLAAFFDRWNFQLSLRGPDTLLDGADLPLAPPPLERATSRTLRLIGDNGGNTTPIPLVVISASLDSLAAVPEPSAVAAVAAAAAPLLFCRRAPRRRRPPAG